MWSGGQHRITSIDDLFGLCNLAGNSYSLFHRLTWHCALQSTFGKFAADSGASTAVIVDDADGPRHSRVRSWSCKFRATHGQQSLFCWGVRKEFCLLTCGAFSEQTYGPFQITCLVFSSWLASKVVTVSFECD